jgi:hypothetical protein
MAMSNFVLIGKRLIPREHVALVEPFSLEANPRLRTERDFKARVVLINRDSILNEETPEALAKEHGFRMLPADNVATNPAVSFRVETFAPAEGFKPAKPYVTRLLWRDLDGNDQSKLLLTDPETVLAIAVKGEAGPEATTDDKPRRAGRRKARAAANAPASQP